MDTSNCGCTEISYDNFNAPINIAPAPELAPQQAALLTPKPVVPPIAPININVWIKDTEQGSQVTDSDLVDFTINFTVSVYDEATNTSRQFTIPKHIQASKRKLLSDAEAMAAQGAITVIETTEATEIEPAVEVVVESTKADSGLSTKRMRELAGIPHNNNYV